MLHSYWLFNCHVDLRVLHSFPTRRSSDLPRAPDEPARRGARVEHAPLSLAGRSHGQRHRGAAAHACPRSEEHTSELQSRPHLVCRLLLEKKKKTNIHTGTIALSRGLFRYA